MADGHLVLVAGALLTAGLAASLLAGRLRLPSLVLFLGVGMAVGTDGLGWVDFSDYELARDVGIVALALILFEGGLNAGFAEIRPVLKPVISLAVLGTLITAAICGLAATWLFDFTLLEGLLLGAIVSSTDGAAIFAMLRGSSLKRRARAHARGRGRHERPGRGAARRRLHRLDPAARLRRRRHAVAVRARGRRSAPSSASRSATAP